MAPLARRRSTARRIVTFLVLLSLTLGVLPPQPHPVQVAAARAGDAPAPYWPPSFGAAATYPAAYGTADLVRADLNGDGLDDVVTINADAKTVSVLLGDGAGAFRQVENASTYQWPYGSYPIGVAVADFNGDGKPDVVTTTMNAVILFLGRGDGTLPSRTITIFDSLGPTYLRPVAAADLNGDGKADLVTGADNATAAVFLGNGDATFRAPVVYGAGVHAAPVRLADTDEDGTLDLVAFLGDANAVGVLRGNGDGTFRAALTSPAGTWPTGGIVVDLDGDAHLDVVALNYGVGGVRVMRGAGDGTFGPGTVFAVYPAATRPGSVDAGDVDGDGHPDLLVTDGATNTILALRGTGDGTFGAPVAYAVGAGTWPSAALVADLNRDGRADLLTGNYSGGSVGVLLGQPPPARLRVAVNPTWADRAFVVTVTAVDAAGRTQPGYRGTVRLTSGDPRAVLPADYTFTLADNGTHTFTANLRTAGVQTVGAVDTALPALVGTTTVAVAPAPATTLRVAPPPTVAAGAEFAFTVLPFDQFGNVDTAFHGLLRFGSDDDAATLPQETFYHAPDGDGMTFRATLRTPGQRTITVTPVNTAQPVGQASATVMPMLASPTPSPTSEPTAEPTPTPSPTPSPTPEPTPEPTPTPSPTSNSTPEPSPAPTPTPSPTPSATPEPSANPTPTPRPSASPSPTASPTPGPSATPSPAPRFTLRVAAAGPGTVTPAGGDHAAGTVLTLVATPDDGALFLGWWVDGQPAGWPGRLTLRMDRDHAVRAYFAPRPRFLDAPADPAGSEAIAQLAARGIVRGYADGTFGPGDRTLRAQMAALICRAMGWEEEDHGTGFTDRAGVDEALWRNVGTLAARDVARGYPDGTYQPTGAVLNAQAISFITRAMVARGYWQEQPDDGALYPLVPADSGHRRDLATYVHYVGPLDGTDRSATAFADWDQPTSRGWFAVALWRALDTTLGR